MYKTGTIAVTNNSAIVTGSGTLWVDAGVLNPGDLMFCPDGTLQEVLSFQSNTQLTLAGDGHGNTVYLGATLAGQAYGIVPIGLLPSSLALQVKTTLTAAQTAISSAVLSTAAQGLTATQQTNARANILALGASDVGKGRLSKSVAGGVEVVLTAAEAANQFIELTGVKTANINVIVPSSARLYVIFNATTDAYTTTIKTAAGTGVPALKGGRMFIECDGTNCVDALSYMRQTGGSIDNTPVGLGGAAAGSFTTLSSTGAVSTPGITFPATQVASANANTLDDYEEGTFTPVLTTTGTPFTSGGNVSTGSYVKKGREVTVLVKGLLSGAVSAGTGNVVITGLPFPVASDGSAQGPLSLGRVTTIQGTYVATADAGTTTVSLSRLVSGAVTSPMAASEVNGNSGPWVYTTITYFS